MASANEAAPERSAPTHLGIRHDLVEAGEEEAQEHEAQAFDYEWYRLDEPLSDERQGVNDFLAALEIFGTHEVNNREHRDRSERDHGPVLQDATEPRPPARDAPDIVERAFDGAEQ